MTPLFKIISETIAKEGPVTLERYMDLVLQHPTHGYYRHFYEPLGQQGEFMSAPEVSPMFGELTGLWFVDMWHQAGKPDPFVLLELGPGRGNLLQDTLRATAKVEGFHRAMKLYLLESNVNLRAVQTGKLAAQKPVYLESLAQLPALPVFAVANEFFDTMPIRQFMKTGSGWRERLVDVQNGRFVFTEGNVEARFLPVIEAAMKNVRKVPSAGEVVRDPRLHVEQDADDLLTYEIAPRSFSFIKQLSSHICRHGGAGLVTDYGYAAPSGMGTLQAVKQHKTTDVFESPGEISVTAHVDFAALKRVAAHEGARVAGPTTQGEFLRALGADLRAMQLMHSASSEQAKNIESDLRRLIEPGQMGALYKALGIFSPTMQITIGFP